MAPRHEFYRSVALENHTKFFPHLKETNERVQQSQNSARLYHHPEALALPDPSIEPVPKTRVRVINFDSFDLAGALTKQGSDAVTVLNMANPVHPGGGYLAGSGAQEEALCRRSTLYLTIAGQPQKGLYPIPKYGGIYSPDVLIFRCSDDANCAPLVPAAYWWTSVISVAAVEKPLLEEGAESYHREEDWKAMKEKIRTILRIAAHEGRRNLVLGAFGCGAFGNPPRAVAGFFKDVLQEIEFRGRFEVVWFAVIERGGSQNFAIFKDALDGMEF